jgi:hypothetical protein
VIDWRITFPRVASGAQHHHARESWEAVLGLLLELGSWRTGGPAQPETGDTLVVSEDAQGGLALRLLVNAPVERHSFQFPHTWTRRITSVIAANFCNRSILLKNTPESAEHFL